MSRWHTTEFDFYPEYAFRSLGGRMTLEGGGKGGSSAPPPDPALVAAQIKSMGIQDTAIQRIMANSDELQPLQKQQMQFGIDTAKTAYDQAQADRQWGLARRGELDELQATQLKDARDFSAGDRGNELAEQAMQDVNSAYANARGMTSRALASRGISDTSGAAISATTDMGSAQAMAAASAANKTREAARQEGFALTDRAALGRMGFQSQLAGGIGAGAGYGAAGLSTANSGLGGMNSGYTAGSTAAGQMGSNATGMWNAQANFKNQQDQIASNNDPFKTILGAAAGIGTKWGLSKF